MGKIKVGVRQAFLIGLVLGLFCGMFICFCIVLCHSITNREKINTSLMWVGVRLNDYYKEHGHYPKSCPVDTPKDISFEYLFCNQRHIKLIAERQDFFGTMTRYFCLELKQPDSVYIRTCSSGGVEVAEQDDYTEGSDAFDNDSVSECMKKSKGGYGVRHDCHSKLPQ